MGIAGIVDSIETVEGQGGAIQRRGLTGVLQSQQLLINADPIGFSRVHQLAITLYPIRNVHGQRLI